MQKDWPDASLRHNPQPKIDYSDTLYNSVKNPVPHPKYINILPNNTASPYNLPRVRPLNAFGMNHTVDHSRKRILLPGVPTGSTPSGVPLNCYFPNQNTMTGAGSYRIPS